MSARKYELIDIVENRFNEQNESSLADKWRSFFLHFREAGVDGDGNSILRKPYIEQITQMASASPLIYENQARLNKDDTGRVIFQIDYKDLKYAQTDFLHLYEEEEDKEVLEEQEAMNQDSISNREIEIKTLCYGVRNNWSMTKEAIKLAVMSILRRVKKNYALALEKEKREIIVTLTNFELTKSLIDIGSQDLNKFVRIQGVISEFDDAPSIDIAEVGWKCRNCNNITSTRGRKPPTKCEACSEKIFDEDPSRNKTDDFMYFVLQDPHELLKQGQLLPPSRNISITGTDLVKSIYNVVAIGKNVAINGVPRMTELIKGNSYVAQVEIECWGIELVHENIVYDENLRAQVAADIAPDEITDHYEKLKRSIAPHLEGLEPQKEAILLMLVGAPPLQQRGNSSKMRGDINILLLGDTSTGKTELLNFAHTVNRNSIYVQGQNATKVGLTAAIKSTEVLRAGTLIKKTSLSAGVYGMASKPGGLVCIDELTKVADDAHYEVMSSAMDDFATMYVHKSIAHTQIKVNCASLHAANPVTNSGKYDVTKDGPSQTNFHTWLWSRYDLKFLHLARRDEVSRHLLWQRKEKSFSQMEYDKSKEEGGFDQDGLKYTRKRKIGDIFSIDYLAHEIQFLRENILPYVKFETGKLPWITMMGFWNHYNAKNTTPTRDSLDRGELMYQPLLDERSINSLIRLSIASAILHRRMVVSQVDVSIAISLMRISISQFIPKIDDKDNELRSVASATVMLSEGLKSQVAAFNKEKMEFMQNFFRGMQKAMKWLHRRLFKPCQECKGTGTMLPESGLTNIDVKALKSGQYPDSAHIPCHSCLGTRGSYDRFDWIAFQQYMAEAKVSVYTNTYFELMRKASVIEREEGANFIGSPASISPSKSGYWKIVRDIEGGAGFIQMNRLANEMFGVTPVAR